MRRGMARYRMVGGEVMRIGKRAAVTSLRDIWPKESDFSDWLVSDDGLALIAEDTGVEIEDPERESCPGDFSCDIVGHAVGEQDHVVVIENQFGKTNHDHLGKLLTYAAMHSAMTGIWIAETVSDDHRKVIDWLNDNTPPSVSFYLAQLKAYRIGDSPVAPILDVVSRPNLVAKIPRGAGRDELKAQQVWCRALWEDILDYIRAQKPPFRVPSPSINAWSTIRLGRSEFELDLRFVRKRGCVGCELYLTPAWKHEALAQLEADRESIEREIGEPLKWMPLPGKKAARILLEAPIDPSNDANRDRVRQWMYAKSIAFYRAFHPRVKALKAPESGEVDDAGGEVAKD